MYVKSIFHICQSFKLLGHLHNTFSTNCVASFSVREKPTLQRRFSHYVNLSFLFDLKMKADEITLTLIDAYI